MVNMLRRNTIVVAIAGVAAAFSMGASQDQTYVIRNARINTMSSAGILERGSVVVADGKIADVGLSVKAPAGARIINGQGLEVYPGMINAWGNVGLTEIGSVSATNDTNEIGDFKPHLLAFSAFNPASEHIPVARVNGITTSLSAPAGGVIGGQAVLIHLDGWTADEMAILKSAGMVLDYPSIGGRAGRFSGGFSRFGPRQSFSELKRAQEKQVKDLTELLEKARHYAKAREANAATERDRQLDALIPVVNGQMTVFLGADTVREIRSAVEFAKKEKLKFVIQGGREADKVADLLKKENASVILDSIISLPVREDDPYDARFTVPRDLAKAGVRFALTAPSSSDLRNLPYEAGFAQAYGLSHEEALKSVTLYPAEILGVADKIGSIEKGKIADLVVTDGDLLELRTQVKDLFIAGRSVSLENRHTKLYQQYLNRP
jgi:imidazolonepropionase-like amidohydrolase